MHHPELLEGVFSIAGGMVIQAEPDVFEDEQLLAAQRATPIVIVHGTKDSVVPPSTGDYVIERFRASGFPMLRYLTPAAEHAYDFLPIDEAVRWLDVLSTRDGRRLTEFAQAAAEAGEWRDVAAALARAAAVKGAAALRPIEKAYDAAAVEQAEHWRELIRRNDDSSWVDGFLAWRDLFEFAPAAAETMEAYRRLQAIHEVKAEKLLADARIAFQTGRGEEGRKLQREVVERWYACRRYRIVKRWVGE
jgi:hypothetical protein